VEELNRLAQHRILFAARGAEAESNKAGEGRGFQKAAVFRLNALEHGE